MVEGVPDKHEDLHLDPCYPYKKLGKVACACSSSIRRWRQKNNWSLLAGQYYQWRSSSFRKKLHFIKTNT